MYSDQNAFTGSVSGERAGESAASKTGSTASLASRSSSGPADGEINYKKNSTKLATAEADRREKRALERKLAEMEEELRVSDGGVGAPTAQRREESSSTYDDRRRKRKVEPQKTMAPVGNATVPVGFMINSAGEEVRMKPNVAKLVESTLTPFLCKLEELFDPSSSTMQVARTSQHVITLWNAELLLTKLFDQNELTKFFTDFMNDVMEGATYRKESVTSSYGNYIVETLNGVSGLDETYTQVGGSDSVVPEAETLTVRDMQIINYTQMDPKHIPYYMETDRLLPLCIGIFLAKGCSFCRKRECSSEDLTTPIGPSNPVCPDRQCIKRNLVSLKKHINMVHETKRQYKCEHCSKMFKRKETLMVHARIHTGEKPFVCYHCDYSSETKGNLKAHTWRKHKRALIATSVGTDGIETSITGPLSSTDGIVEETILSYADDGQMGDAADGGHTAVFEGSAAANGVSTAVFQGPAEGPGTVLEGPVFELDGPVATDGDSTSLVGHSHLQGSSFILS
ncbi:hypothetical protein HAZT_HAZT000886 [Hyalella azteca]|uniref:C2H2-type domain-containing protein n=1 Tax=Hyalella azteca TaxID=294128 RepID=A0A6A0GYG3_HYAAZ|nr:hypothetical protein HAZT_HAZT000886 [Hyalella azteca]